MKVPADYEGLEADPNLSLEAAVEVAKDLGGDARLIEDDVVEIDSDIIINTIGFHPGDAFLYDNGRGTSYNRVVRTNQFAPGFSTCMLGAGLASTEAKGAKKADWSEYGSTYGELWVAWLQGRIVPIEETRTYVRTDTGEEVEV